MQASLVLGAGTSYGSPVSLNVLDFGALPDGLTNCAAAIQAAIDQCHTAGGGRVIIPSGGVFVSGSLLLRAGVDLHLESGSVLRASGAYVDYAPEHRIDHITGGNVVETVLPRRAFISGYQAHGARITGNGMLDGHGRAFIERPGPPMHLMRAPGAGLSQYLERPFTIFLIDSDDIALRDFRLEDPAFWALRISGGTGIDISGLRIHSDLMVPNADGIDIDRSSRVRISNCEIVTADDCISLKANSGTAQYGPTRGVVITNCTLTSASGAITLGCDAGDIRDVVISDCVISDSNRGIALRPREGGVVERILISDCIVHTRGYVGGWWGHGEPIHVSAFAWEGPDHPKHERGNKERQLPGAVRDVVLRNVVCRSGSGVVIWGQWAELISSIRLENVLLHLGEHEPPASVIDMRPCPPPDLVESAAWAFDIRRATDVHLVDCAATVKGHQSHYVGAVNVEDAPGIIADVEWHTSG